MIPNPGVSTIPRAVHAWQWTAAFYTPQFLDARYLSSAVNQADPTFAAFVALNLPSLTDETRTAVLDLLLDPHLPTMVHNAMLPVAPPPDAVVVPSLVNQQYCKDVKDYHDGTILDTFCELHTDGFWIAWWPSGRDAIKLDDVKKIAGDTTNAALSSTLVTGENGIPDYVDRVVLALDQARAEYRDLGFRDPPGETIVNIYATSGGRSSCLPMSAALSLSRDDPNIMSTSRHEFFHRVEWEYTGIGVVGAKLFANADMDPAAWAEASATWGEQQTAYRATYSDDADRFVYSSKLSYFLGLPQQSFLYHPPFTGAANDHAYGAFLLVDYIVARHRHDHPSEGVADPVRWSWSQFNGADTPPARTADVVNRLLQREGWNAAFWSDFALASYSLDYVVPDLGSMEPDFSVVAGNSWRWRLESRDNDREVPYQPTNHSTYAGPRPARQVTPTGSLTTEGGGFAYVDMKPPGAGHWTLDVEGSVDDWGHGDAYLNVAIRRYGKYPLTCGDDINIPVEVPSGRTSATFQRTIDLPSDCTFAVMAVSHYYLPWPRSINASLRTVHWSTSWTAAAAEEGRVWTRRTPVVPPVEGDLAARQVAVDPNGNAYVLDARTSQADGTPCTDCGGWLRKVSRDGAEMWRTTLNMGRVSAITVTDPDPSSGLPAAVVAAGQRPGIPAWAHDHEPVLAAYELDSSTNEPVRRYEKKPWTPITGVPDIYPWTLWQSLAPGPAGGLYYFAPYSCTDVCDWNYSSYVAVISSSGDVVSQQYPDVASEEWTLPGIWSTPSRSSFYLLSGWVRAYPNAGLTKMYCEFRSEVKRWSASGTPETGGPSIITPCVDPPGFDPNTSQQVLADYSSYEDMAVDPVTGELILLENDYQRSDFGNPAQPYWTLVGHSLVAFDSTMVRLADRPVEVYVGWMPSGDLNRNPFHFDIVNHQVVIAGTKVGSDGSRTATLVVSRDLDYPVVRQWDWAPVDVTDDFYELNGVALNGWGTVYVCGASSRAFDGVGAWGPYDQSGWVTRFRTPEP